MILVWAFTLSLLPVLWIILPHVEHNPDTQKDKDKMLIHQSQLTHNSVLT